MGGIMSSRYSDTFRSCVIMNGALAFPAMLWFSDIPDWCVTETLKTDQYHKLTQQDYNKMLEQSPMIEPVRIPILQFLGAKDLRVPPQQGHLFEAIAKKHGA